MWHSGGGPMSDGRADRAGMPAEGYLVSVPLELEGQVRAQWERRGRGWTARTVGETPEGRLVLRLTCGSGEGGEGA